MEIYVEYALIENFCVDLALLFLSRKISKLPIKKRWLFLGATLGAIFAVCYPFLALLIGKNLVNLLKAVFPLLICRAGFGGQFSKNERGRYALNVISFYALSFAFAGGVYAVCGIFNIDYALGDGLFVGAPVGLTFAVGVGIFTLIIELCKRVYRRRKQTRFIYPCELAFGDKRIKTDGFVDSGNVAKRDGRPVCFVSVEILFALFGEDLFGSVADEMAIATVAGGKKIKLFFLDEIRIYCDGETNIISKPYCAVNSTLGTRDYQVLLGAWALD